MELFKLLGKIAIEGSDEANKQIDNTSSKAESTASKFGGAMKKVGGFVVKAGAAAATAAGAAGVAAAKLAMDYDDAFAQVNTLLTGSESDIQAYKDAIIQASNETGKSTTEMSSAIYNAISAGVDQADAINFTTEAMKLAKGGFTDATTAVDVLTTAINAYGLKTSDATAISDKLITTQNLGKTTVDELASSMGKIIPTANSLGVDIDQLCAGYAVMTSNGIATAETTTYMNSMFNELGKSGTKAQTALAEYTEETLGSAKSMQQLMQEGYTVDDVLAMLQKSAADSGKSIADMFGSAEAGKAATVLLNNADKFNDSLKAMGNSTGATEEAFVKMDSTMSSRIEKLKTNFQNMGIQMGEKLLPYAEKFMDALMQAMPQIQGMIDKMAPVIESLFDKIVPIILDFVNKLLPTLVNLMQQIMPPVISLMESVLPVIVELASQLVPVLGEILTSLMPIVKDVIMAFLPLIQQILPILTELLRSILPPIIQIIKSLMPILQPILGILGDLLSAILPPLTAVIEVLAKAISSALSIAFKNLEPIINSVRNYLNGLMTFISGVFTGNWSKAWEGIKKIFSSIWEGLVATVKFPLNNIIDMINKVFASIGTISIPDWVPFVGGSTFSLPQLPRLAKGGVLEKGQVGLLEGDGAEAVVPLEKNTEWIRRVSQELTVNTASNDRLDRLENAVVSMLDCMSQYLPQMANMQVVMDTGATVGALAPQMDRELGKRVARSGRGVNR